ncbi:MAG TPA: 2-C-methyl-D-erythritol 2,4-cyclodiphosphate synthase [Catalimonadaceae bacterium]|nr:2-C-methyl-D-erythritol 2,4-cyclodiphosphate synthase [Catalimonadaceae bacterium]
MKPAIKIGLGYDVHRLVEGRELWLGGVRMDSRLGALGHSDADVLLHAICDALLGALALGDIGVHFADTDPAFKNIDSKILLKQSYDLIRKKGWLVGNVDCVLILQKPKISPFTLKMRETIAKILEISVDEVSIKATTSEQLGFVGENKGVEAKAVCLIFKPE